MRKFSCRHKQAVEAATSKFYSARGAIAIRRVWRIYILFTSVVENLDGLGFARNLALYLLAKL
jgi:hypothetical protein